MIEIIIFNCNWKYNDARDKFYKNIKEFSEAFWRFLLKTSFSEKFAFKINKDHANCRGSSGESTHRYIGRTETAWEALLFKIMKWNTK